MSNNFQLLYKQDEAHDDSIWTITWCKCGENGIEYILTGGADGIVKSWKWIDNKIIEDNKMMGKCLNYQFFQRFFKIILISRICSDERIRYEKYLRLRAQKQLFTFN